MGGRGPYALSSRKVQCSHRRLNIRFHTAHQTKGLSRVVTEYRSLAAGCERINRRSQFDVSGILDEKSSQWLETMQTGVDLPPLAVVEQHQCRIALDLRRTHSVHKQGIAPGAARRYAPADGSST